METKMIKPAQRTADIHYAVRDIVLLAEEVQQAGKEVYYLNIGDPIKFDFEVPEHLIEAVSAALRQGHNSYAHSSGLPQALQAIEQEAHRKGIKSIQEIFTANGASEAIEIVLAALVNKGEQVLLPSPGYPLYAALAAKLELEAVSYYLDEQNHWYPDIDDIAAKITPRTRALVIINPNNPTGSLYSRENLEAILELARRHNLVILSDEIYDKIIFDGQKHIATAALADDVPIVTFGGLSKCWLAPGWRMGWAIFSGPGQRMRDFIEAALKMTRARLCANHPIQWAIKPALEGDQQHIPQMVAKLQRRRDIACERLNAIPGIECVKPTGAFYAFPHLHTELDDKEFVCRLIKQTGVIVVHGSGFGQKPGTKHFRIVTLPPEDVLDQAFTLIADFMRNQGV